MKKICIFDFGNVLIRFEPSYMTAAVVKDEDAAAKICPVVFDRLYWDPLDRGAITDDEVLRQVCARLPDEWHEAAREVYRRWYSNLPEIAGMRELLHDLKQEGRGLYLLSNISEGFEAGYASVPSLVSLLQPFDGLVFSGSLHMVKPSAEIFRHLLQTYGLRAEDCVFIDDSPINVAGARAVGIEAILFDGDAQALRAQLI